MNLQIPKYEIMSCFFLFLFFICWLLSAVGVSVIIFKDCIFWFTFFKFSFGLIFIQEVFGKIMWLDLCFECFFEIFTFVKNWIVFSMQLCLVKLCWWIVVMLVCQLSKWTCSFISLSICLPVKLVYGVKDGVEGGMWSFCTFLFVASCYHFWHFLNKLCVNFTRTIKIKNSLYLVVLNNHVVCLMIPLAGWP